MESLTTKLCDQPYPTAQAAPKMVKAFVLMAHVAQFLATTVVRNGQIALVLELIKESSKGGLND